MPDEKIGFEGVRFRKKGRCNPKIKFFPMKTDYNTPKGLYYRPAQLGYYLPVDPLFGNHFCIV